MERGDNEVLKTFRGQLFLWPFLVQWKNTADYRKAFVKAQKKVAMREMGTAPAMAMGCSMALPGQLSLDTAALASTPHVEAKKDKVARRRGWKKQYGKVQERRKQGSEVVEKALVEPVGKTRQVANARTRE